MIDFRCSSCDEEHEQLLNSDEDPAPCPNCGGLLGLVKVEKFSTIRVGLAPIDNPKDLFEGMGLDHLAEGDGKNPHTYESTSTQVDLGGK